MRSVEQLDTAWIEKALLKRRSNYSPVICVETSDPKRLYQLKSYILNHPEFKDCDKLFVYDRWDGLGRLIQSPAGPRVEPYRKYPANSVYGKYGSTERGLEMMQFKAALREVDSVLRSTRSVFVIQNLAENREWESGLQSAIRSWVIDPALVMKGSVIFVVTSDAASVLDDYTRELIVIIQVDPSSASERRVIIETSARELGLYAAMDDASDLVVATAGLNLHQLESVLLESYHRCRRFDPLIIKELKSDLVKKSGILEVREPVYSFQDIGGYEVVKDFVRRSIVNVLGNSDRAKRFALPLPKGILLFGPPGTGKSLFANALASEIQLPFINLVTENIYSKWLGESGQKMKNAIRLAEKMSPAIVFVDEIDRFGRRSSGVSDSAGEETRRVFSQFLEWLGNPSRGAIIIGTTNVPGHLDEAFMRAGRFDYKIPFLYPGERARLDILLVHLGLKEGCRKSQPPLGMDVEGLKEFLWNEIVPLTFNFSCAELEELTNRAKRTAFDRGAESLEPDDFIEAARTFRVDVEHRTRLIEAFLEEARRFTDDQRFLDEIQMEMGVTF